MTLRGGLARAARRLRDMGGRVARRGVRVTTGPGAPAVQPGAAAGQQVRIIGQLGERCVIDVAPPGPKATITVTIGGAKPLNDLRLTIGRIDRGTVTVLFTAGDAAVDIGRSPMLNARLDLGAKARVEIGDGTTAGQIFVNCARGSVRIGRDCMASRDVMVMAATHHGIVDLSGAAPVPVSERPEIVVGDHVWLGFRSTVVGSCQIGHGAVLGAGAVAAGRYDPATTIVGNPARVVRRDVTWSRVPDVLDASIKGFLAENPELLGGSAEPLSRFNTSP